MSELGQKQSYDRPGDMSALPLKADIHLRSAQAVRDLIVDAWLASADAPVGYPMVNVRDIESGKVRATRELFGADQEPLRARMKQPSTRKLVRFSLH